MVENKALDRMILEDYIERNARLHPRKTAILCDKKQVTYAELYSMVSNRAEEIRRAEETTPSQHSPIVCLRALPTIDYLVSYFALHLAGKVVVPLERELPDETFNRIEAELCRHDCPSGSADILYTTGTTGLSKGVIISHRAIIADAENLIDGQGFSHELAFVVNGPLNHIGSLSKVWPVVMLGGTLIIVDGLKDLNRFFDAFDYPAQKMATFLVPASIRILIQMGKDRIAALADKMDFIETGAAAISLSDMQTLCRLLPKTRLYNTYASTETGIISTYNYNNGHCEAGCLGRPMKHSHIIITPDGLIACKGATLMTGYIGDPERTAAILKDGMVYTSDIGTLDEQGMLHLNGRAGDVVNVGGFKVSPTEVEAAALSHPDVRDCVCISVDHKITGQALKLLVVMSEGKALEPRVLARYLKKKLETYKIPLLYAQIDEVARTFNGKIDRKHYQL